MITRSSHFLFNNSTKNSLICENAVTYRPSVGVVGPGYGFLLLIDGGEFLQTSGYMVHSLSYMKLAY